MSAWSEPDVTVIGGGMAGCEAAWQLAELGFRVALCESKPAQISPAHQTPLLAELVCSNSLRSDDPETPAGMLKRELRQAGSLLMACAASHRVPAGNALAVDRFGFGRAVTVALAMHPRIRIERRPVDDWPTGPVVVATGPLTAGPIGALIRRHLGGDRMYFYDAIAPIVAADSIDMSCAYKASRWNRESDPALTGGGGRGAGGEGGGGDAGGGSGDDGEASVGDYINCPIDKDTYRAFVAAVKAGRQVVPHEFEEPRYFESCLPIEVMAERGDDTLRYGPMRPVGLTDPRTGRWPHAVVQLRPENRYLTAYNLVGFQTRLAYPEQQRIFAMVPALARAEWLRFGSIHRNTYVDAPRLLGATFELLDQPQVRLAGLLTGVEGYIESCAMGLVCAHLFADAAAGRTPTPPPPTTMMGALYTHVRTPRGPKERYAPTNVNFGLLPPVPELTMKAKDIRRRAQIGRAVADFDAWAAARRPRGAAA
ncbi:MAG: methylenetetrahydrofolate--tRNA-(uracil(54)-C(5))-methyltransferase (FADH(2)-oxidizing) TrmFO [Kofleriaceae bacterium]